MTSPGSESCRTYRSRHDGSYNCPHGFSLDRVPCPVCEDTGCVDELCVVCHGRGTIDACTDCRSKAASAGDRAYDVEVAV